MATLSAPADIEALGFTLAQFNLEEDADFDAYLQAVIDEAESEIILHVGGADAFAALTLVNTPQLAVMKKGEKRLVESQLWSRRVISMDAMNVSARSEDFGAVRKGLVNNAQLAEEDAWELIGKVSGDFPGSMVASGSVETGPYSKVSC